MMELNQFIQSTLFEIALGVSRAKYRCRDLVTIAPGNIDGIRETINTNVNFDIEIVSKKEENKSISAEPSGSIKSRIYVVDAIINASGRVSNVKSDSYSNAHRIQFSIPVTLNADHRNDEVMQSSLGFLKNISTDDPFSV